MRALPNTPRRAPAITLGTIALAAGGAIPAPAHAPHAKRPVAVWSVDARVRCATPDGCVLLPPWIKSLHNPVTAVSFTDGSTYFRATVAAVGRNGPRRCTSSIFSKPFSGTCTVHDFVVGFIAPSSLPGPYHGRPDLWVSSESALIGQGGVLQVDPFAPYPADSGNPASPGRFWTTDFVAHPARGESLSITVTRRPAK
jgi:hypothetical protein